MAGSSDSVGAPLASSTPSLPPTPTFLPGFSPPSSSRSWVPTSLSRSRSISPGSPFHGYSSSEYKPPVSSPEYKAPELSSAPLSPAEPSLFEHPDFLELPSPVPATNPCSLNNRSRRDRVFKAVWEGKRPHSVDFPLPAGHREPAPRRRSLSRSHTEALKLQRSSQKVLRHRKFGVIIDLPNDLIIPAPQGMITSRTYECFHGISPFFCDFCNSGLLRVKTDWFLPCFREQPSSDQ